MKKILIVDDDYITRAYVNAVFTKAGFIITEAADGISAMGELLSNKPDVVILDNEMPLMSGMESLKEFKKIAPDVPVVMFTGSSNETLGEAAMRAGASAFIRKPVENEVFVESVQKAMGIVEGV